MIAEGQEIQHIAYFTLKPVPCLFRGDHYHTKKVKHFYIASEKPRVFLKDFQRNEEKRIQVGAEDKVTIEPMCFHKFEVYPPFQVIEYYSSAYDTKDDFLFDNVDGV